jgi:plasmid stabilization system protein ParE
VVSDTVPRSLIEFGAQLERAIDRDRRRPDAGPPASPDRHRNRRRSRRRPVLIGVLGAGGTAAVVVSVLMTTGAGSGRSAWTRHVLRAAAIALPAADPHTIVHVSITQTMTPQARRNSGDPAAELTAQGWFQQGGARRAVTEEARPGQGAIWQAGGRIYDTATRRVYELRPLPDGPAHPSLTRRRDGTYRLVVRGPHGPVRQTVTAAEARALRAGTDEVSWAETWNGHRARLAPLVGPSRRTIAADSRRQPDQVSLAFSAQLHRLLQSGRARVSGHRTVEGRPAIAISLAGADGKPWEVYYVDPATYRPLAFDLYGFGSLADRTRVIFHAYERLPTRGHTRLLRLPAPPGTPIERDATAYFRHLPPALFIW